MSEAEEFFIDIIGEVPNAKAGKMFGALCMKMPNGKSAAMFWKDNIVVKLHDKALQEAMNLHGAQLFEPMEGRPMKEWVQIPFEYKKKWKAFATLSAQSVEALEKKAPKRKK
jgi:hypothetical protein